MAKRIEKSHLISDEALRVFQELTKDIEKSVQAVDKLIAITKGGQATIGMADSLKKINDETVKLTDNQKKLEELQKTLAAQAAKRQKEELEGLEALISKI